MDITTYIDEKKSAVVSYLSSYLKNDDIRIYSAVNRWGNDAIQRILHIAEKGKILRATCVFLGHDLVSDAKNDENLLHVAAGLELCHSGLLIEDDVMDQDETRRGGDSLHIQYQKLLRQQNATETTRTAESLALCAGDMALFLGMQPLSFITPPEQSGRMIRLFCKELITVGIAQMQDVSGSHAAQNFSTADILSVYAHKTGRYSIGLPLVAGALLGGANDQTIQKLWKLGTALGIVYQIRDDYLNIFGTPTHTGKPVGSDIREGKQTLYRYFLLERATGKPKEMLSAIFGNPKITDDDVEIVRKHIVTLGVETEIQTIIDKQNAIVSETLKTVPFQKNGKDMLQSLVNIVTNRES